MRRTWHWQDHDPGGGAGPRGARLRHANAHRRGGRGALGRRERRPGRYARRRNRARSRRREQRRNVHARGPSRRSAVHLPTRRRRRLDRIRPGRHLGTELGRDQARSRPGGRRHEPDPRHLRHGRAPPPATSATELYPPGWEQMQVGLMSLFEGFPYLGHNVRWQQFGQQWRLTFQLVAYQGWESWCRLQTSYPVDQDGHYNCIPGSGWHTSPERVLRRHRARGVGRDSPARRSSSATSHAALATRVAAPSRSTAATTSTCCLTATPQAAAPCT